MSTAFEFYAPTSRPCGCDAGCEECDGTMRVTLPLPEFKNVEMATLEAPVRAFVETLAANQGRAAATGYELTEGEVSVAEGQLAVALIERGISNYVQQHPVGPYFADFYFPDGHFVVEVDGAAYHTDADRDAQRTAKMVELGIRFVLRIRALQVFSDPAGCVDQIECWLPQPNEPA